MFGYIKVYKPELKIKEYEMYKGVYCSLCREIGRSYGLMCRMTLNYDFTFLALCRMALNRTSPEFSASHCSFRYSKKCMMCTAGQEDLEYAAAVSVITVFHKILDNLHDGNFLTKAGMIFVYPYIKSKYKKAYKKYPEVARYVEKQMERQREIENDNSSSVDAAADPSAKSLSYIMSYGYDGDMKVICERFGYCLGRLIYILDAVDDIEKDKKEHSFNPFINSVDSKENSYDRYERILNITADENAKAYELLDIQRFGSIIDNIIYYGFEDVIESVVKKEESLREKSV